MPTDLPEKQPKPLDTLERVDKELSDAAVGAMIGMAFGTGVIEILDHAGYGMPPKLEVGAMLFAGGLGVVETVAIKYIFRRADRKD